MPESEDRKITFKGVGRHNSWQRGENYLLLIGIDEYEHVPELNNAVRDARTFGKLMLERYHFDAGRLTALYNEQATYKNIDQAFRTLHKKLSQEIIY